MHKCKGINCKVLQTAVGWLTCIIVGLTSALFISPGVYVISLYEKSYNCTLNNTLISIIYNNLLYIIKKKLYKSQFVFSLLFRIIMCIMVS